ncbi:MAG: hypothetical protein QM731_21105 [Chitinophagaceae bacterium]
MKTPNRDLLVLVRDEGLNEDAIENELERLNQLLIDSETVENFCTVHEIFDLNKYKVISRYSALQKLIHQDQLKPFVFLSNKN